MPKSPLPPRIAGAFGALGAYCVSGLLFACFPARLACAAEVDVPAPPAAPVPAAPPADAAAKTLPSFAELEAAGATIGEVRVLAQDIFDTRDPKEDVALFRLANKLHIQTRPQVIERALLFKTGERVSVQQIEETERVLRANRYLYDVQIRPLAVHDGVVDIEVATRDTWSLDPGISAGRQGGANSSGVHLADYNLLGTGVMLSVGRTHNVDRSSTEFQFENMRAFGTLAAVRWSHASNSDGRSDAFSVVRPFYRLDARWAAGASASRNDAIEAVYERGNIASQYRHRQQQAEVFGGRSEGLVDGWVRRTSVGLSFEDDRYAVESGLVAPAALPADRRLVAPFVRFDLLEDRFERELNRNLVGRPEFFSLGLASRLQLGWSAPAFGASNTALLYSASASRGFELADDHTLMAEASLAGQYADGRVQRQRLGAQAQYYQRQGPRWLFYAAAAADMLTRPALEDLLQLGGDTGLRGYPLRYESGTRRVLVTVEERFYTDLFIWQLFRIGGAAYLDFGRAWAADQPGAGAAPWLGDVGIGLRIVSARSAFSNVLHVDLAFPLNAPAGIKKLQFLVKTRTSF